MTSKRFLLFIFSALLKDTWSVPMPKELIVNEETKECKEFWGGDEFVSCTVPYEWKSIGYIYLGVTCPDGYTDLQIPDPLQHGDPDVYCSNSGLCPPNSTEQICQEAQDVWNDNALCREQNSCDVCVTTPLTSDSNRTCRWVNSCGTDLGPYCEYCTANDCSGVCNELDDCSLSHVVCAANTCQECLENDCVWTSDKGNCFDSCPANTDYCTEEDSDKCPALLCKESKDVFWDTDYCEHFYSCTACLQTTLPSDETKTCKWVTYTGGGSYCSLDCPKDTENCKEVTACGVTHNCDFYNCMDCLAEECFWSMGQCAEDCSPDEATCISRKDYNGDVSLLQFCLQTHASEEAKCTSIQNYRQDIPCTNCLREGCAWDDGQCWVNCTNGTELCKTFSDFDSSNRLESQISDFCSTFSGNITCPPTTTSSRAARKEPHVLLAIFIVGSFTTRGAH